jgi:hypothetical protein
MLQATKVSQTGLNRVKNCQRPILRAPLNLKAIWRVPGVSTIACWRAPSRHQRSPNSNTLRESGDSRDPLGAVEVLKADQWGVDDLCGPYPFVRLREVSGSCRSSVEQRPAKAKGRIRKWAPSGPGPVCDRLGGVGCRPVVARLSPERQRHRHPVSWRG